MIAPDGSVAAFALGWLDPVNLALELEPVGVHPAYHRRGLGRAVCLAAIGAARALGAVEGMICADGGISPAIGPGMPCGSVRHYEIGQPRSLAELKATGIHIVNGIFSDINCPVIGTDVNDDGVFADTPLSRELVRFANIDWDGNGLADDGVNDPNSTLQ